MTMIGKEIWVVWSIEGDDEYFSTKAKAYARCVELINEIMYDDAEERAECLFELAEYENVTDICGFYSDFIDANEIEMNRPKKFHIYNRGMDKETPMTVNGKAVEFDTPEAAQLFCYSVNLHKGFDISSAYIKEDILFYDGGYIDCTRKFFDSKGNLVDVGYEV